MAEVGGRCNWKEQGWFLRCHIAMALSVSERYRQPLDYSRARNGGSETLLAHPSPGHPPKLSSAQKGLIPEFLWHGPESYVSFTSLWSHSGARVAELASEGGVIIASGIWQS